MMRQSVQRNTTTTRTAAAAATAPTATTAETMGLLDIWILAGIRYCLGLVYLHPETITSFHPNQNEC